jgi:hypothetical protein
MLDFQGIIATTPRVGQNAVLGAIRHAFPGANEYGHAEVATQIRNGQHLGTYIYAAGSPYQPRPAKVTKVVRMRREDRLAQAVSLAMAHQTGRYHSWQAIRRKGIKYSRVLVMDALKEIERKEMIWDSFLKASKLEVTDELIYEQDVLPDPAAAALRILHSWGFDHITELGPTNVERFSSAEKDVWMARFREGR